jgi:hypothetical protein
MTQHLDHPVTPMIDPSVDAATTTPAGGTPRVQNPGWPPPGPPVGHPAPAPYAAPAGTAYPVAPEAPLNTLSWVSVVVAFVVSPVAIVLGAISRRQIARTGERGKGLATTGIALGIVFTLMGIVSTIMVLSMVTTVTYTPAPAPAPAPVAAAPSSAAAPAATDPGTATGQADVLTAYLDLIGANQTFETNWQAHNTAAELRADITEYRDAVQKFRDTVATADLPADQRARIDGQLLPAIDQVLADCNGMLNAQTDAKVKAAAQAFDTDNPAMVQTAADAISS